MTNRNGPYTQHTLENGLHIVIEQMPDVRSAAAGFLVRAGARDETPELAGVSHFLEHMIFKGTAKRPWRQITIDFDAMGSLYNAFTSEDRTMFYGWVREADIARQIELLADMMRPTLPKEEFETEKKVILEEIAMAKDSLEHLTFDFLQEKVFAGHPLEWPILGYESTVGAMTRDQMHEYFATKYAPDNMYLIVTGKVDPGEVIGLAEKYCGQWIPARRPAVRTPAVVQTGVDVLQVSRFRQQVVALTFPSVGGSDTLAETSAAAATILGGENSRFFWEIVQKGIAPRAGAHHLEYTDCGVMILYGSCEPENAEALVDALRNEANRVCTQRVAAHEVDRVKNKRRTSLAVEGEAPYYRLTQLVDDLEYHGSPRTVDQMLAAVEAVSVDSVYEYFQRFPINTEGHLTSVGPRQWPANGNG